MFETTIKIACDDDGVHCGDCGNVIYQWCNIYMIDNPDHDVLDEDDKGFIRCQACLDAQKAWEEKQREKA